jgi:Bacterial Ig-like domain (group 2)
VTLTQTRPDHRSHGPAWSVLRLATTLLWAAPAVAMAQTAAEVQVTPETMTLSVNQRQLLFAAAYDRQGNLLSTAKFTFWSSDTLIVRVMRDGTVVGVAPGLAKVEARVQGRRASMAVLITGGRTDSVAVLAPSPCCRARVWHSAPGRSSRMGRRRRRDGSAGRPCRGPSLRWTRPAS